MMYGERLGEITGIERPPSLKVSLLQRGLFATTRLTCLEHAPRMTKPVPRTEGFILGLQLRDTSPFEFWYEGRNVPVQEPRRGMISLMDCRADPRVLLRDPFDLLIFYVPHALLNAVTEEECAPRVDTLHIPPGWHIEDNVVHHLGECLLPALAEPNQSSQLFVEQVSLAIVTHLVHAYGGNQLPSRRETRGLDPVQERRAKELLMSRLNGEITLEELARECGLSRSHFARAFKQTTGESAHRWLIARRVERARELLLNSELPIAEIGSQLGFADQSHFTRVFHRSVGMTPAAWRRQRREGPVSRG